MVLWSKYTGTQCFRQWLVLGPLSPDDYAGIVRVENFGSPGLGLYLEWPATKRPSNQPIWIPVCMRDFTPNNFTGRSIYLDAMLAFGIF